MATFDPALYERIQLNTSILVAGYFSLRADRAVAVYFDKGKIEVGGVEVEQWVPIGQWNVLDISIKAPCYMKVVQLVAGVTPSVWLAQAGSPAITVDPAEEVFTNIDRMPDESGSVLAVRQALREIELARRAALAELRLERDLVEDPTLDDEPEPDPKTGNGVG